MKYSIKADHKAIKKQIKEWEISLDWIVDSLENIRYSQGNIEVNRDGKNEPIMIDELIQEVEMLTNEAMAINL